MVSTPYSFTDPEGMEGWVGLVGWPIAHTLPTKWSHVNYWYRSGVDLGESSSQRPIDVLTTEPRRQPTCEVQEKSTDRHGFARHGVQLRSEKHERKNASRTDVGHRQARLRQRWVMFLLSGTSHLGRRTQRRVLDLELSQSTFNDTNKPYM